MQEILKHFHREHVAMQRLINQFDQEVESMRNDHLDPDYHLLLEMVRTFNGRPHHHHYQAEQKLHYALRLNMPEITPLLERLEARHAEQTELGHELEHLLDAACSGHLVPRQKLLFLTEDFIAHLNAHITDEESEIIANAEQWLPESGWVELRVV